MEALLLIAILAGVYAGLYVLNHKTPIPKGCEDLTVSCGGCRLTSCERHPTHLMEGSKI